MAPGGNPLSAPRVGTPPVPRRALMAVSVGACSGPDGTRIAASHGAIAAGEAVLSGTPSLAAHKIGQGGDNPDLYLRWNAQPASGALDAVLHFHGFQPEGPRASLVAMMGGSGLDLEPIPEAGVRGPGRSSPTLCLLPRGRPALRPGRSDIFDWPALSAPGGLPAVLADGVRAFAARTGRAGIVPGRVVLTAHSGGGGGLLAALDQAEREGLRIDQVHAYDALYRDPAPLIRWARRTPEAALVVLYVPGTRNEATARQVAAALPHARVLASRASHGDIPRANGWRLLADWRAPTV